MKFVLESSLERITLIKIVTTLWNQNDVKNSMDDFYREFSNTFYLWQYVAENMVEKVKWLEIERKVVEKVGWQNSENLVIRNVSHLPLPELIREKIEDIVRPIGLQILKLMVYERESCYFINEPVELNWTPQGVIDRKKTAQIFVRNENVDITVRFKLSCVFCLEDDILKLWKKMSKNCRKSLSHTGVDIYNFWVEKTENSFLSNNGSFSKQFEACAQRGNKAGAEYFLQKLSPRVREQSLVKIAKEVTSADVLCFLLSQMNEEQQIQVFKTNPSNILHLFLYWPFQSLFLEVVDHMWEFLSKTDYLSILRNVTLTRKLGYKDWNYQNLFKKIWQKSPPPFKSYIMDISTCTDLLSCLLQIKDKVNFELIMQDASLETRKKIIDSSRMQNICECLFFGEDWDLLGFVIEKCLPIEDERKKFKNEFEMKNSIKSYLRLTEIKEKWNLLFPFCNESVCKNSKRKCVADKSKVKRLRRIQ